MYINKQILIHLRFVHIHKISHTLATFLLFLIFLIFLLFWLLLFLSTHFLLLVYRLCCGQHGSSAGARATSSSVAVCTVCIECFADTKFRCMPHSLWHRGALIAQDMQRNVYCVLCRAHAPNLSESSNNLSVNFVLWRHVV